MRLEELPRHGIESGGKVLPVKARAADGKVRLAVVVSHPIQYYEPLYRRLAARDDLELQIFFTWHAGGAAHRDHGFEREVEWDIPLTEGYEHELVPNKSRSPGSHHFWGLRNPELVNRVMKWRPDAVHITGYSFASHLRLIRDLRGKLPILFRGDSHLLDEVSGTRRQVRKFLLRRIYGWVDACLYVGKNNYDYYREFGVPESRLYYCPHSIDVDRFAGRDDELEREAESWRKELRIPQSSPVLLYAGKFERKKRPIELMKAVLEMAKKELVLVMVGNGQLEKDVQQIAAEHSNTFRILPFQNQSRMPVVYRLGDILTLPSAYNETWGLVVNEALACGRRVLVSDKVGCALDVVTSTKVGSVFSQLNKADFGSRLFSLMSQPSDRESIRREARRFDIPITEGALVNALFQLVRH